jgi:hypothetical protein
MQLSYFLAPALIASCSVQPALGQAKKGTQEQTIETRQYKKAAFSGNESRLQNIYHVESDCTSGPEPEARLVTPPKNGDVRVERMQVPVSFNKESTRFHCNGKPVDAIVVVYKSKDNFTGTDRMTLEVNYRDGVVIRYVYVVQVR